ncbi:hypothetical protein CROQUDRAFT_651217 [Cronartium quercuum f. sp. fusiforme G11]|uniref:Uncharacterized protein n=1 Tax=Cronartium quercuum f. sp. fusiforme G11 TaxID=708437 RepID=A0A9P6NXS0_9BASI|nr:hypothetical protein CROQUDRAFT_651217 [Cronartium quercuum f. sp. fusiforme G11]
MTCRASDATSLDNKTLVDASSPARPDQPRWYCPFCLWRYYWSSEALHAHLPKCPGK